MKPYDLPRRIWFGLALLVLWVPAAVADDIGGIYQASGHRPEGGAYAGTVEIAARGEGYQLAWAADEAGTAREGIGLLLDNILAVASWPEDPEGQAAADIAAFGVVAYRIEGGWLRGIWLPQTGRNHLLGREDLHGPDSLDGRFAIMLGENPGGGSHYQGHVDMRPDGETYLVEWYAPRVNFFGRGIRIGNILVVAYGMKSQPAVMAFCRNGGLLHGQWAEAGTAALGYELLRRGDRDNGAVTLPEKPDCAAQVADANGS
jgi:hypothetical protein